MKIINSETSSIDIRLTESVATAAGGIGDRGGIRLVVSTDADVMGFGETAPIPGLHGPGLESIAGELDAWSKSAIGCKVEDAVKQLDSSSLSPLARFAAHTALVDLQSMAAGTPLSQWLRAGAATSVHVNGLVAESNPGAVHKRVGELASDGMRAIKLKVGSEELALDVTRIIAASEAAGPNVELRLDANRAWSAEAVERMVGRVGKHRIGYIEDPTPDVDEYRSLQQRIDVPIALDLPITSDPSGEVARAGVDVIVVKPAAVGGVDRIMDLARALGDARIIVSSSIDREIALAAAIHVAAAMPGNQDSHGLAVGAMVRNLPESFLPVGGAIDVPEKPGVFRA